MSYDDIFLFCFKDYHNLFHQSPTVEYLGYFQFFLFIYKSISKI